jgi:FkbM family methyltransferase
MNSLLRVIEKAVALGRFPLPENPILPWPRFSLASYTLTARLAAEGVNPRTIVDVGANRGQFTVSCMKRFEHPRIYAFEPVPVAFRSLLAATKRFKEVTAYNLAIGERNGQVTFHVASDVQSSSILRQNESFGAAFADAAVTRTIELEMQTLDTALRNVAIDSPVLLKLDVQGYETRVIDGARSFLGAVDVIVAETSFAPLSE